VKLSHWSERDVLEPYSQEQRATAAPKPEGLWVSVDGARDWEDWCHAEEFRLLTLRHRFAVTLRDDANVLVLDNLDKLMALGTLYAEDDARDRIRWFAVALEWQGVIIAPYQWSVRLHPSYSWYYPWDCASCCIWDVDAIENVERIA